MAAQVNIKVNSDFAKASADLKKFGQVTESEAKRIQKFQDSFKSEQIDKFIDKNRRAGTVLKAHGNEVKSAEIQMKNLERQMQSLVTRGLDPQDKSIQKLNNEYAMLEKEVQKNADAQRGMEAATQASVAGLTAIAAAVTAVGVAALKSTTELGKMGDELAKTSAKVGVSTKSLQELAFAAERSGLPANNLSGIFQKLNRNIGDLQAGTGTLATFLNKSNPALAEQLKNVEDSEEAFNILLDEIAKAPTAFDKAALSQAAFGRSGQDIINFANQGSEEIQKLRAEAFSYGIISEETAKKGEAFVDAQRNLRQATIGARSELADQLLPVFTEILNKVALFVADGETLEKTLKILTFTLIGFTSAFVAFLVIFKGAAAVQAFTQAFRILNAVIAANPIGALAVVITAVLIPAIIWLVKNWDFAMTFIQQTWLTVKELWLDYVAQLKLEWIKMTKGMKIAILELTKIILDKLLGGVQEFLELAGKLPFVGEKFQGLADSVGDVRGNIDDLITANQDAARETIAAAEAEREARRQQSIENRALINSEAQARREALKKEEEDNKQAQQEILEGQQAFEDQMTETQVIALEDRLSVLNDIMAQNWIEQEEQFMQFIDNRMEQENLASEDRIAFLESEKERIMALETLTGEERVAAAIAVEKRITQEEKKASEARTALRRAEAQATANTLGAISELILAFAGENREAAIAAKALAHAEAGINSALAFTQVLADQSMPTALKIISAVGILASGIVQQKKIADTPIPSAQTGGTFQIPDSGASARADQVGVMASPGETVSVSPRGEGGSTQNITVMMNDEVIMSAVNEGIERGDIIIRPENIQGGAATA